MMTIMMMVVVVVVAVVMMMMMMTTTTMTTTTTMVIRVLYVGCDASSAFVDADESVYDDLYLLDIMTTMMMYLSVNGTR